MGLEPTLSASRSVLIQKVTQQIVFKKVLKMTSKQNEDLVNSLR